MKYVKFFAETLYAGTGDSYVDVFDDDITEAELSAIADDFAHENAESYEYLVFGWDLNRLSEEEREEIEEELEDYYDSVYGTWEYTTEEEYVSYLYE